MAKSERGTPDLRLAPFALRRSLLTASSRRAALSAGFLAAAALRLLFLLQFPGNYDTSSYEQVVTTLERGGDLYRDTERYNYSPSWALLLLGSARLAAAAGTTLAVAVGLLLFAVDALTALLLFRIAGRRGGFPAPASAALLFFANPVSVLVSGYHGQFDNLAILFLLAALAAEPPGRPLRVAGWLSASLIAKHIAPFHPLLLAARLRERGGRLAVALAPYLVFIASFLPYAASWGRIREHVFGYRGLGGLYGTDVLLLIPGMPFWVPKALFLAASLAAVLLLRRVEAVRASLLLFLVMLIFLPGIGQQYFVWPIALGALRPGPGYLLYTVVAAGFFVGSSTGLAEPAAWLPGWYGPWWAAIAWLLWEVRTLHKMA
jgi:hypothetical protein